MLFQSIVNNWIERYNNKAELNGVSGGKIERLAKRSKFSDYLPYRAYDEDGQYYLNADDTIGFLWACSPIAYAGKSTYDTMEQILKTAPMGSSLQVNLFADNFIDPIIGRYLDLRTTPDEGEEYNKIPQNTARMFLDASKEGFSQIRNVPARHFRLFVSLKLPPETVFDNEIKFLRNSVFEVLNGSGLGPMYLRPDGLCMWLQRIFNDDGDIPSNWQYEKEIPINKQIISGGTRTSIKYRHVELGDEKVACIQTLKGYPNETLDDLTINKVLGGLWGPKDDGNQYNFPFLVSVNVLVEDMKAKLHGKTNMMMFQDKKGSGGGIKMDKQEEYAWAAREVDRGERFVRVIPSVVSFAKSEEEAEDNMARVKRLWENEGFTVNNDRGILTSLFLASLPFGLYSTKKNIDFLERDRPMPTASAVRLLPIQGDFAGVGDPVTLFLGRKGQLIPINLFHPDSPNQNALISATTGKGKSYLMNRMLTDMKTTGGIIRVFDLGRSYKKLSEILKGNFIEFNKESKVCINPFSTVREIDEEIGILGLTVSQMVWSSTGEKPTETQMSIIKTAVRAVWDDYGNDGNVDLIKKVLQNFDSVMRQREGEGISDSIGSIKNLAVEVAFNLDDFTSRGPYGRWFNGKSTLNIENDDFVVLELEELRAQEELFNVVIMQVVNYVTQNLYLSDRLNPRTIVFDEAWQWFKEGSFLGDVVENGYRLARKYYGSFITIFQSLMDLKKFGKSGLVVNDQSAYKFLLEANYTNAHEEGLINYPPFIMDVLESVRLVKGKYSEVFIQTPMGLGVARLPSDPFTHLVFTSDPRDNAKIEQLSEKKGIPRIEAIEKLTQQAA